MRITFNTMSDQYNITGQTVSDQTVSDKNIPDQTASDKNNWTSEKVQLLMKWRQQARVYHWLHAKSSSYKNWWYVKIFYTSVFLSSLGLAQNFGIFFTEEGNTFKMIQIVNAVIITMIGVLNIYLKTSKIVELVEKHSNTSKDFYTLQTEIEEQLAQTPEDREDGKIHLKKVRVKITSLTKESPEISQTIWHKFAQAVKNCEIFNENDPTTLYTIAEGKLSNYSKEYPKENSKEYSKEYLSDYSLSPTATATSPLQRELTNQDTKVDIIEKPVSNDTRKEKKEINKFNKNLQKSSRIEPNILKALDYQMARFN